ncbi:MAG: galactokinase [Chloroflexota bacterium]
MPLFSTFTQRFGFPPAVATRSPGRVNLLGEHVDYNDGFVLPVAIDRSVEIAAAPSGGDTVTLHALDLGESVAFALRDLDSGLDTTGKPLPAWARYPAGVAWVLQQEGLAVKGLLAAFTSSVPIGSGLSSSAAVEVGFAVTWRLLGGWQADAMRIAQLCQRAENRYVGVNCGLMDQFACACGVQDHALKLDTRSLEWNPVPLPPGTVVVVADSGVRRSLATSAYNDRRAACEKAVSLLQPYKPGLRSLRDIGSVEFAAYAPYLPEEISRRAEHVVKEIARVEDAVVALNRGDAGLFGGLMFAGHASLRDLYEVSCPELDDLVQTARSLPGCYGARLTGAGFGGCTVNLVDESQVDAFVSGLQAGYEQHTGRQAQVYACKASAGAEAVVV